MTDNEKLELELRQRAIGSAAYWLDCSPHERTEEDGIWLAKYARVAIERIVELETAKMESRLKELRKMSCPVCDAPAKEVRVEVATTRLENGLMAYAPESEPVWREDHRETVAYSCRSVIEHHGDGRWTLKRCCPGTFDIVIEARKEESPNED